MATPGTLKQRFADGKKPTGQDFAELIDTIQAGSQSEGTFAPVSEQVAIEGTDTLGAVSPAGLKAHIDVRLATQGEAEAGPAAPTGEKERLMTPQRSSEAISYQATPLVLRPVQVPKFLCNTTLKSRIDIMVLAHIKQRIEYLEVIL